jgi:alkanesulfonate monooxygenase SsuD/methylene tetrahydromethanopterin reductase-like flavin-dependent oxidoreductase (luciferase family)
VPTPPQPQSTPRPPRRVGFFSRLLDDAPAAERYRLVAEQIAYAERFGFDSAWVAQHHFHEAEGGLPSPFVFLAHVAALTRRIRLGTGVVTLPLESAVRVAEDAVVLDLLSGHRLEFGVGTGGTPSAFAAFGQTSEKRAEVFAAQLSLVREAWGWKALARWRPHLSLVAPVARPHLASHLLRGRRRACGCGRRRPDALAHPAAHG